MLIRKQYEQITGEEGNTPILKNAKEVLSLFDEQNNDKNIKGGL